MRPVELQAAERGLRSKCNFDASSEGLSKKRDLAGQAACSETLSAGSGHALASLVPTGKGHAGVGLAECIC